MTGLKLDRDRTTLIVVDVQEAFRKAIPEFKYVAKETGKLVQGAKLLDLPIIVTEQYPKGLGKTVDEVAEHLPDDVKPLEKVRFSAVEADGFKLGRRDQAIVCGIETHVCVNQTVLDLLEDHIEVHVPRDAVGSRTTDNWELGLHKLESAGAIVTSVEAALFELLRGSDAKEFKEVQALVK